MAALYTAVATIEGGREGRGTLAEGGLGLSFAFPKELGGSGKGANPEQLFALGYAACFNQALIVSAKGKNVDVAKASVTAKVGIGKNEKGGFALEVELQVRVPGASEDEARALVEAAHQICPYSNATRGNVPVTLTVV